MQTQKIIFGIYESQCYTNDLVCFSIQPFPEAVPCESRQERLLPTMAS